LGFGVPVNAACGMGCQATQCVESNTTTTIYAIENPCKKLMNMDPGNSLMAIGSAANQKIQQVEGSRICIGAGGLDGQATCPPPIDEWLTHGTSCAILCGSPT
jgi:hypothetical protein